MESGSEDEEEMLLVMLAAYYHRMKKKRKNRRFWVHPINLHRREREVFHSLMPNLYDDEEKFVRYFRVNREQFAQILHYVSPDICKKDRTREVLCPRQRLAICLR